MLVSFPPLSNMLKFGGSSHFISGQIQKGVFPPAVWGGGSVVWASLFLIRTFVNRQHWRAQVEIPARRRIYLRWALPPESSGATDTNGRRLQAISPVTERTRPIVQHVVLRRERKDTERSVLPGIPKSAICVQKLDDSLNSAIRITYRISLRSSSLREPRYPLLRVVSCFD